MTMHEHQEFPIDLTVDLNSEDDSGLPWTFIDEARDRSLVVEGAWLVVGEGSARAVAQVIEMEDEIVRVRPLPGPVDRHRHLLDHRVAWLGSRHLTSPDASHSCDDRVRGRSRQAY